MNNRPSNLPIIIMSGASGFIGRYVLSALKEDYYIYALARRSQKAAGVSLHKNIDWVRIDIGEEETVKRMMEKFAKNRGADYFFHFAGFYDFNNKKDPEYTRTNVEGTRYLLENCEQLHLKRFIFSSSLTVTKFVNPGTILNEKSPLDATFPYAISKARAEELIKNYSSKFPCTIIRQAAIYSDWCEYRPLYSFLSTWLSDSWNCRVLAGKGDSAIPYLHINDLIKFFLSVIHRSQNLPNFNILVASPDGCTSHRELFEIAAKYNYFKSVKPIYLKKWIICVGIIVRNIWGSIRGKKPFECSWMMKYIDTRMDADSFCSRKLLSWESKKKYDIKRRLLILIGNLKSNRFEWEYKNEMRPFLAESERQYFKVYDGMIKLKNKIVEEAVNQLISEEFSYKFYNYQRLEIDQVIYRVENIFKMLEIDVRTGDRSNILNYGQTLAEERYREGFESTEVIGAIRLTADIIVGNLLSLPDLKEMEQRIRDEILITLQMVADKIEDTYESLTSASV